MSIDPNGGFPFLVVMAVFTVLVFWRVTRTEKHERQRAEGKR